MGKKDEYDFLNDKPKFTKSQKIIVLVFTGVLVIAMISAIVAFAIVKKGKDKNVALDEVESSSEYVKEVSNLMSMDVDEDAEYVSDDPEADANSLGGVVVDENSLMNANSASENDEVTLGIDVAKYQGTIDWAKVADSGIDFAMIRVGYRVNGSREIVADTNAKYNMQEANANGIKVGVYFFSTATTQEEAQEEAEWVASYISRYKITYPVAYDCEGYSKASSVQSSMTKKERTDVAIAFMKKIHESGYTPMFYSSKSELEYDYQWETSRLENICKIWVSQYPSTAYPDTPKSSYTGKHAMWQYTSQGKINGISQKVDINVAYFGYDKTIAAQSDDTPDKVSADAEALMDFEEVNEKVTAKEITNLRSVPSQATDSTIVCSFENGDTATRTGISTSGWSRVIYNGKTCYVVSSLITNDLSYKPAKQEEDSGFKTQFTDINDTVTAKVEVNLRNIPSVTSDDSEVVATIKNGETIERTGISKEMGWSRVVYNGQTLYCVTSYLEEQ